MSEMKAAQISNMIDKGRLSVQVTSSVGFIPIKDAKISISLSQNPNTILEEVTTNISGETEMIELSAPPMELSLEPSEVQPYAD